MSTPSLPTPPHSKPPQPVAPLMLGVSGLRGIIGRSLTPDLAARYAASLATWLCRHSRRGHPRVVLGMDGRRGGDILLSTAAQALRAAGCDCLVVGTVMTPTIGFLVDHTGADAGLIITASHNPQDWNGLKIVLRDKADRSRTSAAAPPADLASEIIAIYRDGDLAWKEVDDLGTMLPQEPELIEQHQAAILAILKESGDLRRVRRKKYRIALDTVGGAGGAQAPGFLEALGCDLFELYPAEKFSGTFPHTPEPTRENLTGLCSAVKRRKADIGFALDPDGDRLAIVDERGRYIGEEYTLALSALSLAEERLRGTRRKTTIALVTNLSTSRMLDDIAARYGAHVVRTPVGEANVVEAMKRKAAERRRVLLGGEGNGGVIWPEVTYIRDSLGAMALVLSLMARSGHSVSELTGTIPPYAIEKRKVDLARREDAGPLIERLATADFLHAANTTQSALIDRQDGIRLDFPAQRSWIHVRPSNTEPIMRLIAEAPSAEEARALLDAVDRLR